MTRAAAATYVAGSFYELLTDAGVGTDDSPGELGEVIDDALLMTGVAYGDLATATVADADVLGFRKVLAYAALLRIADARADRASSLSSDGSSVSWNRSDFQKRIDAAASASAPYRVSGEWGTGAIVFDYEEPRATL